MHSHAILAPPSPPDWLDALAQDEWSRVAPLLVRHGLLTDVNLDALAVYCQTWGVWKDAHAKLRQFGSVIKSKTGAPVPSPYLSIATTTLLQLKGLMLDLGMTPRSRSLVVQDTDLGAEAEARLRRVQDRDAREW